jgi:hypothetical protein
MADEEIDFTRSTLLEGAKVRTAATVTTSIYLFVTAPLCRAAVAFTIVPEDILW